MSATLTSSLDRWTAEQLASVQAAFSRGTSPTSPFGKTEAGALDFIGVTLDEAGTTIRGLQTSSIDFSESELATIVLIESKLASCNFEGATLRLLNNSSEVSDSSFDSSRMATSVMGGSARFSNCTFRSADLTGASFKDGVFESCDFSNAKLDKLDVKATLRGCTFAGNIERSFLRGRMEKCDFSASAFIDCAFYGAVLIDCKFAAQTIHVSNWPSSLRAITEAAASSGLSDKARSKLERKIRVWLQTLPQVKHQVIDERDLVKLDGKDAGAELFSFFKSLFLANPAT